MGHILDAGLGVVGRYLALDHLVVAAAGHEGHAVGVSRQLQREGLRDRDGLEQVLHAQQHRGLFVLLAAQQPAYGVQFHGGFSLYLGLGV